VVRVATVQQERAIVVDGAWPHRAREHRGEQPAARGEDIQARVEDDRAQAEAHTRVVPRLRLLLAC
jgi:hypothetical protein